MAIDVGPFLRDGRDSDVVEPHLELVTKGYVVHETIKTYEEGIFDEGVQAGRASLVYELEIYAAMLEVNLAKGRLADVEERIKQLRIEELSRRKNLELAKLALADCGIAQPATNEP